MLKSLLKDPILDLRLINKKIPKLLRHEKLEKKFFKLMVKTWSEDEDSRRLLAFLNIMKALSAKRECAGLCIKLMFVAFVRNCKFVLASNIAQINLMRECLLELFGKNLDDAYIHAFVYTRQLAITLRKAYSSKTKEDMQSVANWQFVYSLRLWCDFASRYANVHTLVQSLIHPLSQLVYGTIKLNKGQRWLPLHFHCVSMLHNMAGVPVLCETNLSNEKQTTEDNHTNNNNNDDVKLPLTGRALSTDTRLLIPTLPILLDVFQLVNFNQRSGRVSNAPLDLRLLLHFTPSQLRETASNDAIINWLFDLLAECMALHANSIVFPEYSLPFINEVKQFLHVCRVASFCRQMKALMVKVREHSEWIVKCRRRIRNLASRNEILNIESTCTLVDNSNKLLPFWKFYVQHKQIRFNELNRLTESNKKEPIPTTDTNSNKMKSDTDDDSNSDSDHTDSSYDIDDGKTITHVSKSKLKQNGKKLNKTKVNDDAAMINVKNKATDSKSLPDNADQIDEDGDEDDGDESDFDLEAALMDNDDDDDNKSVNNVDLDELPDFELDGESSTDDDDDAYNDLEEDDDDDPQNIDKNSDIEMIDLSKLSKIFQKNKLPPQQKIKTTAVKKVHKPFMLKMKKSTGKFKKKSKVVYETSIKLSKRNKTNKKIAKND
ncbi:unnamed protein product [Schistosoma turkestanicum]|nr:unnamed protein product [Schistosoma turkestanicum]